MASGVSGTVRGVERVEVGSKTRIIDVELRKPQALLAVGRPEMIHVGTPTLDAGLHSLGFRPERHYGSQVAVDLVPLLQNLSLPITGVAFPALLRGLYGSRIPTASGFLGIGLFLFGSLAHKHFLGVHGCFLFNVSYS